MGALQRLLQASGWGELVVLPLRATQRPSLLWLSPLEAELSLLPLPGQWLSILEQPVLAHQHLCHPLHPLRPALQLRRSRFWSWVTARALLVRISILPCSIDQRLRHPMPHRLRCHTGTCSSVSAMLHASQRMLLLLRRG